MKKLLVSLIVATFAITSIAFAQTPAPLKEAKAGDLGTILTGPNSMTLYTFANDKEMGKSACSGSCAETWPAFLVGAKDPAPKEPLSVITRPDGSKQYAYKGKPLYYFKNDNAPGDTKGDKFRGIWFAAKP